jgi:hypothetical protein
MITEALASTSAAWARRCIVLEPEQPDDSPCNDENGYNLPGNNSYITSYKQHTKQLMRQHCASLYWYNASAVWRFSNVLGYSKLS